MQLLYVYKINSDYFEAPGSACIPGWDLKMEIRWSTCSLYGRKSTRRWSTIVSISRVNATFGIDRCLRLNPPLAKGRALALWAHVEGPPSKNPSEAPSYQAPTAPLILTQRVIKFLIPGRGNKERLLRATLKFDLVAHRRKVRTGSHSRHDRDDFRFERP